jgi:hypothetical protein
MFCRLDVARIASSTLAGTHQTLIEPTGQCLSVPYSQQVDIAAALPTCDSHSVGRDLSPISLEVRIPDLATDRLVDQGFGNQLFEPGIVWRPFRLLNIGKPSSIIVLGAITDLVRQLAPTVLVPCNVGLAEPSIVRETTGRRRGRIYAYSEYLALLDRGTDPLPA